MAAAKVAYQTINIRSHNSYRQDLVQLWSNPTAQLPDKADSAEKISTKAQNIEQAPRIETVSQMTGNQLRSLIGGAEHTSLCSENFDNLDLETLLLLCPILLVDGDPPSLTGNIHLSIRNILRMNFNAYYQVLWVSKGVVCDEFVIPKTPSFEVQVKASELQTHKNRLTKGDISRKEAEMLGISPAALRKRKSRERLRSLTNEKK